MIMIGVDESVAVSARAVASSVQLALGGAIVVLGQSRVDRIRFLGTARPAVLIYGELVTVGEVCPKLHSCSFVHSS